MKKAVIVSLLGLAAAGCQTQVRAPCAPGVCWREDGGGALTVIETNIDNLETCAARLEVYHLAGAPLVRGAFGGAYIQIDHDLIAGSAYADGPWSRLLRDSDRARIDLAIRQLQAATGRKFSGSPG